MLPSSTRRGSTFRAVGCSGAGDRSRTVRPLKTTTLGAALFAAAAAALAVTLAPADPDMWWHLASGDWMVDHGTILDRDVFSYTRAGASYSSGQWLGQVVLALAFRAGSWVGLDVLRAGLVGLSVFFSARVVLRLQPHIGWAALPVFAVILVSKITWGDRPQLFTLALFPVLLDILLSARARDRILRLAAIPPVMLLWSNLHGAFVVGLALIALFALEAVAARRRYALPLAATLGASVAATLLNPNGASALVAAFSYASLPGSFIVEERPPDILSGAGLLFAFLLLSVLGAALALGHRGITDRIGSPALWLALVVPFTVLALTIQRQMPLAGMILAPFAAAAVPAALGRPPVVPATIPRRIALPIAGVLAVAVVACATLAAPTIPDLSRYPSGALDTVRSTRGALLNEYDWGGYLIHQAPGRLVFIDGRGALLFVPDVLRDFQTAVRLRPGYRDVLDRWDIGVALLRSDRPLATALREEGWSTLAEEPGRWVLLARP